ncbi:MAG TPA: septum formation initiator family protein [Candidatus Baltobacteraceae bacterium]|nr:septum formation initiator family protein [Candidatus Baltobacteraceae bacterium]
MKFDDDRPSTFRHLRWAILFLIALVVASVMGNRSLLRVYQLYRDDASLTREIEQLSAANAALAEEVRALRTDPARVEAIARDELGLVKPGELVFEFRRTPPPAAPAPLVGPGQQPSR